MPSLYGSGSASWVYLVDWILALIIGLAFVFWFARLTGFVISLLAKFFIWHRYKIAVSMDALKVSPLGGRITAKNVVISNCDHTISVLRLNFTWRYWLLQPTKVCDYFMNSEQQPHNEKLPSCFQLYLDGLEVFMYNRSFVYDNIMERLNEDAQAGKESSGFLFTDSSFASSKDSPDTPASDESSTNQNSQSHNLGLLVYILPMQVRVKRGVLVVGNLSTPSLLVASFKSANSLIDALKSPSVLDKYRMLYDLSMEKFQVSLKPNLTYNPSRYSLDANPASSSFLHLGRIITTPIHLLRRLLGVIADRGNYFHKKHALRQKKGSKEQGAPSIYEQWRGLGRYMQGYQDDRVLDLATIDEYAKFSLIIDTLSAQMVYYYDVPGTCSSKPSLNKSHPKFGVDLILSEGTVNYGSWADRQRGPIQSMLFPNLSKDAQPTKPLQPGARRQYDGFSLNVIVKDEVIIRIPTREISKDKEALAKQDPLTKGLRITRPFGWLELKITKNSKISSFTSYIATNSGWSNSLSCNFLRPEMRSSVNHDVLFIADEHNIECDLGYPLQWNGKIHWLFKNYSKNGELFFLRDHAFFMSDLIADFGSGAPTPYEQFRPFHYTFDWTIENYKIFLNVNDHNIINEAMDFNSNKYICCHGKTLDVNAEIPLLGPFTKSAQVDYKLSTDQLLLSLEVPQWHTAQSFMDNERKMGQTDRFEISGSYTYYNKIEINYTNFATIHAIGDNVTMQFFGYFIRYLFTFRENYMGDFKHFRTFEEYTHNEHDNETVIGEEESSEAASKKPKDVDYWNVLKTENDLNVLFTFKVRRGMIVLPCNMFSSSRHIGLTFERLDVDLHLTSFYMDLQADFGPIIGYYLETNALIFDLDEYLSVGEKRIGGSDLIIDGFQVHAHRMLGLAPALLTYTCKWDFACESWEFDTTPMCLSSLKIFFINFGTGFKDLANTAIYEVPVIYDAAHFSFRCPELVIKLTSEIPNIFLRTTLKDLLVSFNDVANDRYSSKVVASIPEVVVEVIDETEEKPCNFHLKTTFMFSNIGQKANMREHNLKQQEWLRENDAPTHRSAFLLRPEYKDSVYRRAMGSLFPSVSLPDASIPLTAETAELEDDEQVSESEDDNQTFQNYEDENPMEPTVNYDSRDFAPQTPQLPNHKTGNFIMEFGTTEFFISPTSSDAFASIIKGFPSMEFEDLLDVLEDETITSIKMLIDALSMVDNIRVVAPEITCRVIPENVASAKDVWCSSSYMPLITFSIVEPSLAFTKVESRGVNRKTAESCAFASHIKEIYVAFHDPQSFAPAFTSSMQEIEAWMAKDEFGVMTLSGMIEEIDFLIHEQDIEWTVGLLTTMVERFKQGFDTRAMPPADHALRELVFMLAMKAKQPVLEQDPSVLTKPSTLVRSCEEHVRFHEGWKLTTKLRDILQNLLPEERSLEQARFYDRQWKNPDDALSQTLEVFNMWRHWEINKAESTKFLNDIFGKVEKGPAKEFAFSFDLGILNAKVMSPKGVPDTYLMEGSFYFYRKPGNDDMTIVNLQTVDASCSPTTVDAINSILRVIAEKKCAESEKVAVVPQESPSESDEQLEEKETKITVLFLIQMGHFRVDLPGSFAEMFATENNILAQVSGPQKALALKSREIKFKFGREKDVLALLRLLGVNLVASQGDSARVVDLLLGGFDVKITDKEDKLPVVIEDLKKDIERIQGTVVKDVAVPAKSKQEFLSDLGNLTVNVKLHYASLNLGMLDPLKVILRVQKTLFLVHCKDGLLHTRNEVGHLFVDIKVSETPVFKFENSHLTVDLRVSQMGNVIALDSAIDFGYLSVTIPQLTQSMHSVFKNLKQIQKKIEKLQSVAFSPEPEPAKLEVLEIPYEHVFHFTVTQEYFGISTFRERTRYTLEIEGVTLDVSNVALGQKGAVPLHGEIHVPTTRISVIDPEISSRLSTVLDVDVSAKLLNDYLAAKINQSLQVESQHFRICLSAPVLFKIVNLVDQASRGFQSDKPTFDKPKTSSSSNFFENLATFHVLSYNFCLGWLFENPHQDYPGVILGCERFFAVTNKGIGKLSLMEGYLSAANGNTCSTFYSTLLELRSLNRAYMPKMQLNYCILQDEQLCLSLKGDELDVQFMSNSVVIFERAVKSGSQVQDFFRNRARNRRRRPEGRQLEIGKIERPEKPEKPEKTEKIEPPPFKPKFTSVRSSITFAGSKVLFYRLQEEDQLESAPLLQLHSPLVHIASYYKHNKDKRKKHEIKFEVLMQASDNTVYASCVPVVMDFVDATKSMFRTQEKEEELEVENTDLADSTSAGSSIGSILELVDFSVGVIVEEQRLSFSCEPMAKVAAVMEFDGASISAVSGLEDPAMVYVITQMRLILALLQHMYSDEKSGFIKIKNIIFSNSVLFGETVSLQLCGSISDVIGSVKMKQYYDLDLFKDIWYPKSMRHPVVKEKPKGPWISKRAQAFPVALTYILLNFALEVDFGAALGVVALQLDKAWLVSRKTADWFYDIKMGIGIMDMKFSGRLDGYLRLNTPYLLSAIEWKLKEVPLLQLLVGFEQLSMKLAFDRHVFAVVNLEGWLMEVLNRKNGAKMSKDNLYVEMRYAVTEVFLTSLAALDVHDIASTISRMIDEKRTSYKEILDDLRQNNEAEDEVPLNEILEVVKKLETRIEVETGRTTIQVFPQLFDDLRVLVVELGRLRAEFLQNEYTLGVSSEIELQMNNLRALLSTPAGCTLEFVDSCFVSEFVEYARKSLGGTIFKLPKFMISMRTFQKYNTNVVEFLYQLSFGGTVDMRWNLGSVNCVREMYAAHKKALLLRTEFSRKKMPALTEAELQKKIFEADTPNEKPDPFSAPPSREIDRDIHNTFDKVANRSRFIYTPLAPPIIETPRLKDLGNATPPLEWFGLHRDKFPDATHQFGILTLQKLIHTIEVHWLGDKK